MPVSTDPQNDGSRRSPTNQKYRRFYGIMALGCLILLVIYAHNLIFYRSVGPVVETIATMEDVVLQTQKNVREDIFELLHNIRLVVDLLLFDRICSLQ